MQRRAVLAGLGATTVAFGTGFPVIRKAHAQTITLNGVTHTLNWFNPSTATSWNGITINYQLDGNYRQQPYTVYLDNVNFSYF